MVLSPNYIVAYHLFAKRLSFENMGVFTLFGGLNHILTIQMISDPFTAQTKPRTCCGGLRSEYVSQQATDFNSASRLSIGLI